MKKLSNKSYILIIIISIISSLIFGYITFNNFNRYAKTNKIYKEQNKSLKEEIKLTENDINASKSKINLIDEDFKNINSKSKELENIKLKSNKEEYYKYLLSSVNLNLDRDRKNSVTNSTSRFRKLRSTFYSDDEVSSKNESLSNIAINTVILNDYTASSLNKKIVSLNNKTFKNIGLYNYFENTNNYLLKEKIASIINESKFPVKEEELKNLSSNLVNIKEKVLIMYDTLLYPSDFNYNYIVNLKTTVENEKNNSQFKNNFKLDESYINDIKKINNIVLFGTDTFSQNIDYLRNFDILDKTYETSEGVQVLRYLVDSRGRLYLVEERIQGNPVSLNYYNSSGEALVNVDMGNYKVYYFNKDKTPRNKYDESMNLYNKYRRN